MRSEKYFPSPVDRCDRSSSAQCSCPNCVHRREIEDTCVPAPGRCRRRNQSYEDVIRRRLTKMPYLNELAAKGASRVAIMRTPIPRSMTISFSQRDAEVDHFFLTRFTEDTFSGIVSGDNVARSLPAMARPGRHTRRVFREPLLPWGSFGSGTAICQAAQSICLLKKRGRATSRRQRARQHRSLYRVSWRM